MPKYVLSGRGVDTKGVQCKFTTCAFCHQSHSPALDIKVQLGLSLCLWEAWNISCELFVTVFEEGVLPTPIDWIPSFNATHLNAAPGCPTPHAGHRTPAFEAQARESGEDTRPCVKTNGTILG